MLRNKDRYTFQEPVRETETDLGRRLVNTYPPGSLQFAFGQVLLAEDNDNAKPTRKRA